MGEYLEQHAKKYSLTQNYGDLSSVLEVVRAKNESLCETVPSTENYTNALTESACVPEGWCKSLVWLVSNNGNSGQHIIVLNTIRTIFI